MNDRLPPIETWWPELDIEHKHRITEDLDAPLDAEVLDAIGRSGEREVRLSDEEKTFVREQGETVD